MAAESSIDCQLSIDLDPVVVNSQSVESGQVTRTTTSVRKEDTSVRQAESGSRTDEQHASGTLVSNDLVDRLSAENAELDATETTEVKTNGSINQTTCNQEAAVLGRKRARTNFEDQQAVVHVTYECLSRESKTKLEELLCTWSKWHAHHSSSSKDSSEALESGKETYFPALNFGSEKSTVSFLMDNQVRKKQKVDCVALSCDSVPLYDREYEFALTLTNGSTNEERGLQPLSASRCFNCGSYDHSLKECPRPRDNVAVTNARKQFQLKNNHIGGPRVPTRYYQNTPRGKYDGLKPGALDPETRKLLGLGELDPPPWLHRMRELGYPPGYLEVEDEDQPSGIMIYADEESELEPEENVKVDVSKPRKKRSVDFPGLDVPARETGNQSCWAASQAQSNFDCSLDLSNNRANYCPEFISQERSQRLQSGSADVFFAGYARELDSFMSSYSQSSRILGQDGDRKLGTTDGVFAGDNTQLDSVMSVHSRSYNDLRFGYNSESGSTNGFTNGYRHEVDSVHRDSPTYGNFGPNYNSESANMNSFSGGYRHVDFISGYSPSYRHYRPIYRREPDSPSSFSPYTLTNLHQS